MSAAPLRPLPASAEQALRATAEAAMRAHGFAQPQPGAAALSEAAAAAQAQGALRDDTPGWMWLSIDNPDSQDLDQLSCVEASAPTGPWRLHVAVADVRAAVVPGGAVDDHAHAHATTVYTDAGLFPMLPLVLSHAATSLLPGALRAALALTLDVATDGRWACADVRFANVRSQARLAYADVAAWLAGKRAHPFAAAHEPAAARQAAVLDQLRAHAAMTQALAARRDAEGALDLSTTELTAVRDAAGHIVDWQPRASDRAQEVIAEIMVAANSALAQWLAARGVPHLVRVLRPPRHWERLRQLAAQTGGELPAAPSAPPLAAWLRARRVADPSGFAELSLAVVKMLGGGGYDVADPADPAVPPEDTRHFALALARYTHATAPNRRYADVTTHRQVAAALAGTPAPYDAATLRVLAPHCSQQGDAAAKVARQVRKAAMALMLDGTPASHTWDAVVTGAAPKGVWVRTRAPQVEGRLVQGEAGLAVGDQVRVRLLATDPQQGHIDFACIDNPTSPVLPA